jgi:cytoskeleton protein RodZ
VNEAVPFPANEGALGPGAMLAQARRDAGLSVAEIALGLRYSVKQIEALEADDYPKLPGTTFVRGMMRGYAKMLKIPAEPIVQALDRRHIPSPVSVDLRTQKVPFSEPKERSNKTYAWLSLAMVVVVAVIVLEWIFGLPAAIVEALWPSPAPVAEIAPPQQVVVVPAQAGEDVVNSEPAPAAAGSAMAPSSATPAESPKAVNPNATSGKLRFEFQKDAWVEVREGGGRILISQVNLAGTKALVEGTPPFNVIVGNASSVRMFNGDSPVDLVPHTKVDVARFTLNQ